MRKNIYILFFLVGFNLGLQAQNVGINTLNPQALFHFDGASTPATTNPETGNISAERLSDDVIISTQGNLGLGVGLNPTQKLDITSPLNTGLRIVDGTEGIMKVLISNDTGVGSWAPATGLWSASLIESEAINAGNNNNNDIRYENFNDEVITSNDGGVNRTDGTITIPYNGTYRIYMSSWYNNAGVVGVYIAGMALHINGNEAWSPTSMGLTVSLPQPGVNGEAYGCRPTFITIGDLEAGDVLTFFMQRRGNNYAFLANAATCTVELIQIRR